jgi:HEAT repeat protein
MFQIRFLAAVLLVAVLVLPAHAQPTPSSPQGDIQRVRGKTLKEWLKDFTDDDASVRNTAILAIPEFGPAAEVAVQPLIDRALHDNDAGPRCDAVMILPKIKIAEKDVPRVVDALGNRLTQDPQGVIKYQAALGLITCGKHARGALKELIAAARAQQATWQTKHAILVALQSAGQDPNGGSPDTEVVKIFLEQVHNRTAQVRLEAIIGLGALGRPKDANLLAEIGRTLLLKANDRGERDPGVRIWANASLMALDKVDDALLKRISEFLKHTKVDVRIQAARALGTVGDKAKAAVPTLIPMLDDKEKTVVFAVTDALLQINADGSTKAVIDNLKNADADIRAYTARAVGAYGDKIRNAVPAVAELVRDKETKVVMEACIALAQMGNVDPRGRQALMELKDRKDTADSLKKLADECLRLMDTPPDPKRDKGR